MPEPGGGVFRSTNNGISWTEVNSGITYSNGSCVSSFAISGTNIYAGTYNGIFLSTNNGNNWVGLGTTGLTNTVISAIAISGTKIFAGTTDGMFLSTNSGSSWTAINTGLTDSYITSVKILGSTILATTAGGIFRSTSDGSNWSRTGYGWGFSLSLNGTVIYAGMQDGVYLSVDDGSSWEPVNYGLINYNVLSTAIIGTNLFAGTAGSGVWVRPLSEITGIETNSDNPGFGIFPNPATDEVTLSTSRTSNEKLILNIYSITGALVRSEILEQNQQQISICDLSNGIYVVEIKSNGLTGRQKLIIQR